jgi:VanZ family protein
VIAARPAALFSSPGRMIPFLRYWLPLLLWMIVIFSASADTESTERTSRFLEPFLRWLNPNVSTATIELVRLIVRKAAHAGEYALLSWLAWRAFRRPRRHEKRPWSWPIAAATLGTVILYAATDEFHQLFVPNRTGSFKDVCIDAAGGAFGLSLVWLCYRRRIG